LGANSQAGYRLHLSVPWRGTGAEGERETGRPREKGAGGVWEAGEEGAGSGFSRWREAGEKGIITQHCAIFHNRKNAKRR